MRRTALLLICALLCTALLSCSKIDEDEAALAAHAESLIERADILNRIYWGEGIDKAPSGETLAGNDGYTLADVSSLAPYGIYDYNSLKEYTSSVYSANECDSIFKTYLTYSVYNGSAMGYNYTEIYTRYLSDAQGKLYVRDGLDNLIGDTVVKWDYSTLKVVKRERHTVTLSISVRVCSSADSEGYADEMQLELRREGEEYRLNTPIYCKYDRG